MRSLFYLSFILHNVLAVIPAVHKFNVIYNTTDKELWFTAIVPKDSYLGIGFGSSMTNTGIIFMSGDSKGPYTNGLFATGTSKPPIDNT